jgi:hypothetical protein
LSCSRLVLTYSHYTLKPAHLKPKLPTGGLHMTEQEYLTITQAAAEIGWNRATVYDWMKTLGMEKHHFVRNKHTYIHITDIARLKEIKEKPWTAGRNEAKRTRNIAEKGKKAPVSQESIDKPKATERPQKTSVDDIASRFPPGTVSSGDFAKQLGIEYDDFKNYMRRGVDSESLEITEQEHPTRKGYKLKFLTPTQQEKAVEILKRHGKL